MAVVVCLPVFSFFLSFGWKTQANHWTVNPLEGEFHEVVLTLGFSWNEAFTILFSFGLGGSYLSIHLVF